jgi:hypothetical protein
VQLVRLEGVGQHASASEQLGCEAARTLISAHDLDEHAAPLVIPVQRQPGYPLHTQDQCSLLAHGTLHSHSLPHPCVFFRISLINRPAAGAASCSVLLPLLHALNCPCRLDFSIESLAKHP